MDVGPFRFYRVEESGDLCISIKWLDNWPIGWEWGFDDPLRGVKTPWISIRIGKLNVLYFEVWKWGFEFWLLGFWIII